MQQEYQVNYAKHALFGDPFKTGLSVFPGDLLIVNSTLLESPQGKAIPSKGLQGCLKDLLIQHKSFNFLRGSLVATLDSGITWFSVGDHLEMTCLSGGELELVVWENEPVPAAQTVRVNLRIFPGGERSEPVYSYTSSHRGCFRLSKNPTFPSWKKEKVCFHAFPNAVGNTVPIYQYSSESPERYLYSQSGNLQNTWRLDGVAFHAFLHVENGTFPVYQYHKEAPWRYLYTLDSKIDKGWIADGVAFHAFKDAYLLL